MAQTFYKVPFSYKWYFSIVLACTILFLILFFTLGGSHPAPWVFISLAFAISFVGTVFDPGTARLSHRKLEDGTVIRVKKPLVGLKCLETRVADEVADDGFRYEGAYFRL